MVCYISPRETARQTTFVALFVAKMQPVHYQQLSTTCIRTVKGELTLKLNAILWRIDSFSEGKAVFVFQLYI